MGLLIFILVLSFLVLIHELGHFLVAKKAGVKVDEFGMGYPPRAWTMYKDKDGTEYTLNWLPFGGFVRMYGEDGPDSDKASSAKGMAFFDKPVGWRIAIVLAGVTINFLFGVIAFGAIYTKIGIPTVGEEVSIEIVSEGSPAEAAGIESGDVVLRIDENEIGSVEEFIGAVSEKSGETVALEVRDKGVVPVYVRTNEEIPQGEGAMGVMINDMTFKHYPLWQMPFRGMVVGLQAAVNFGVMLVQALGEMLSGLVLRGDVPDEVAGPIGIAHLVQREGILDQGWLALLNFAAILSINLAIVNMLPFPALDGGRFLFLLYELVTARRIPPQVENISNVAGFALLLLLIVLISVRDVGRIFADEGVREWWMRLVGR